MYDDYMILFSFQVNGTRVTHCTHVDVVNLIKCKLDLIDFLILMRKEKKTTNVFSD